MFLWRFIVYEHKDNIYCEYLQECMYSLIMYVRAQKEKKLEFFG